MATSVSVNRGSESSFDCEFVEKPPVIQSECPVCLQILCEPYQVSCCGYSFCRVCIERLKSNNKPCPTCKEENFATFHNKGLQRSLYEFQVYCSHKQEGCEWKGELCQLDNHLNLSPQPDKQLEGCEYSEIECIYCFELIKRCNIAVHQTDLCPKRPFSCEYCHGYESHYEDVINSHWPVCDYHPVQCPNECGTFSQHQALENHVTSDCPKTVIGCDFHHVGCDVRLPRKDMPAHLNENLVTHMSLQAASYSKLLASHSGLLTTLQQKVDKLESENETLRASHTTLQASHNKLQTIHSELQDKVRKLKIENKTFKQQLSRLQVSSKNENAQHNTVTPMLPPPMMTGVHPTMQQHPGGIQPRVNGMMATVPPPMMTGVHPTMQQHPGGIQPQVNGMMATVPPPMMTGVHPTMQQHPGGIQPQMNASGQPVQSAVFRTCKNPGCPFPRRIERGNFCCKTCFQKFSALSQQFQSGGGR